jgi:hypothetical protein
MREKIHTTTPAAIPAQKIRAVVRPFSKGMVQYMGKVQRQQ